MSVATGGHLVQQVVYNYDVFDRKVDQTAVSYDGSGTETTRVSTGFVYDGTQILPTSN